jgi:hypothetical protein
VNERFLPLPNRHVDFPRSEHGDRDQRMKSVKRLLFPTLEEIYSAR